MDYLVLFTNMKLWIIIINNWIKHLWSSVSHLSHWSKLQLWPHATRSTCVFVLSHDEIKSFLKKYINSFSALSCIMRLKNLHIYIYKTDIRKDVGRVSPTGLIKVWSDLVFSYFTLCFKNPCDRSLFKSLSDFPSTVQFFLSLLSDLTGLCDLWPLTCSLLKSLQVHCCGNT